MTVIHAAVTVTSATRRKKMKTDCALYRKEKVGDGDYYTYKEYCDGLTTKKCKGCRFYKSNKEWIAVGDGTHSSYMRIR